MNDPTLVQFQITSNTRSLPIVRGAVEKLAKLEGFSDEDAYGVTWAIDEALANVIKHGYDGQPDQPIQVTMAPVQAPDGRTGIEVRVRDQGRQVDPNTIRSRPLDEIRPGGLGVHIIQTIMDVVDYSCPEDGGMLLRMVKYARAQGDASAPPISAPAQSGQPQPTPPRGTGTAS